MESVVRFFNSTMANSDPTATSGGVAGGGQQTDSSANSDTTMPTPFFFLAVFVLLMAVFGCCNSPYIRRLMGISDPTEPEPVQTPRRVVVTPASVEERAIRAEFVKSNLPFRIVEAGDEEMGGVYSAELKSRSSRSLDKTHNSQRSIPEGFDDRKNSSRSITSAPPKRSSFMSMGSSSRIPVCSICLSGYDKGDEVAWSTNPSCQHKYHRECIHDWLLKHEDCPLCRNVFLPKDSPTMVTDPMPSPPPYNASTAALPPTQEQNETPTQEQGESLAEMQHDDPNVTSQAGP